MRKRPLFLYACVFLAGMVCYRYEKPFLWGVFIIWLGYEVFRLLPYKRVRLAAGRSVLLLSAFILGNMHMQNEMAFRDAYLSKVKDGEIITVWGEISKLETTGGGRLRLILSDCFISLSEGVLPCNDIMVYTDSNHYENGEIHKITGELHIFETADNEGGFDSYTYYLSQKIDMCVYEQESELLSENHNWIEQSLWKLKSALNEVYESCVTEETAGFLRSMILGDRSDLNQELKTLFTNGGIAHILAISGLHVSIIGRGFYQWLRKRGAGFLASGILAGSVLCAYCYMVGNGMSAVRAVGMMLILFGGQMLGRSYDMLNSLGVMMCFLLWENPFLLEYSGFWFSVLALIGVGYVSEAYSSLVEKGRGLGMSVGITLSTLPVVAYCYYEIPLYSPIVNFLLLPILTPIFVLALLGGVAGLLCKTVAAWILLPCEWGLSLYEWVCQRVASLPGAIIITGKPSVSVIVAYYVVLLLGVFVIKCLTRRRTSEKEDCKAFQEKKEYRIWRKWELLIAGAVVGVCFALIVYPKPHGAEITFLDVGQGDGIYISTGDGSSYFIDGGSTDEKNLGRYCILPFLKSKDIEQIDYWFVTHADSDHISGLLEVMESGYCIRHLVVADLYSAETESLDEKMSSLIDIARNLAIEIVYMKEGDCLKTKNTVVTCLYPGKEVLQEYPRLLENGNEVSLVLEYVSEDFGEYKEFRAIFTGDISSEVEAILLEKGGLQDVNLYKVGHHGSKYSSGEEFLAIIQPKLAVVSCGRNNLYGHPAKETIHRMTELGIEIFYTMKEGQISLRVREGRIKVNGYQIFITKKD